MSSRVWNLKMLKLKEWWGPKLTTADCLKEQSWLWRVERRYSAHSRKVLFRLVKKRRTKFMVKTAVGGAEEPGLQQQSRKALMKRKTTLRAQ